MIFALFIIFTLTTGYHAVEAMRQKDALNRKSGIEITLGYVLIGILLGFMWPAVEDMHGTWLVGGIFAAISLTMIGTSESALAVYADVRAKVNEG